MAAATFQVCSPEVTLLADLSAQRPWTADLVGWLGRVGSAERPIGWASPAEPDEPPSELTALLARGAVLRQRTGAAVGLLAVHLDSWPDGGAGAAAAWTSVGTRVLLGPDAVRRAGAGLLPADADGLLAAVLGDTGRAQQVSRGPARAGAGPAQAGAGRSVMFVSSNGAGMGHLTRLLAMARRCGPGISPVFVSMSQAVSVVDSEGYPWEYIPSRGDLGIGNRRWNVLFERRIRELLQRRRPDAVVFDGTYPYDGLLAAAAELPGTRLVWSRRGMWRAGAPGAQLARSYRFDLVLEPGELAATHDHGATASRDDALRVGPVTLLDPDEQVDRADAARVLGVDPDRTTALVTLGAGNINDLSSDLGLMVRRLAADPDLQVVLTRPVIAGEAGPVADRVRPVSVYPISRYLAVVDFAIAASGYNSFHELVGAAVPAAFVPNMATALDDQLGRARWAQESGAGLCLPEVTPATVDAVAERLTDPAVRAALAARCLELRRPNGAGEAMAAVARMLDRAVVR